MQNRHKKDKLTFKRKKAAVAYYRKLKYERENADKQRRSNQNITPENLAVRLLYLKERINGLINVAYACDGLRIEIPQRLYDQADNKIGFTRRYENYYGALTYKNNDCEILYFDDLGIHFSYNGFYVIFWREGAEAFDEINSDILQDFIYNFSVFESAFYEWFDELVGISKTV